GRWYGDGRDGNDWIWDDFGREGTHDARKRAVAAARVRLCICDVGDDDDRNDDAIGGADDPHLCARWQTGRLKRTSLCSQWMVRLRLPDRLVGILARSDFRAMGAGAHRIADSDDGKRQFSARWNSLDRRRNLSMDPGQGSVPVLLPNALKLHHAARRVSFGRARRACARSSPRPLLHWLLL